MVHKWQTVTVGKRMGGEGIAMRGVVSEYPRVSLVNAKVSMGWEHLLISSMYISPAVGVDDRPTYAACNKSHTTSLGLQATG